MTGHVIPTLCPLSAITAIVIAPRSNSLLDIKLTRLQCPESALCYLRPRLCWQLTCYNTRAPQTLLVEAGPPAIAAPILPGKWPARPQDCRQWQSRAMAMMAESHLPSPPSATAAITLLAMDASLQLKSTFPSHKSQFKSNN